MRYRVTASDGRRVENTIPVGLLRDFPTEKDAWREVDKLGLAVRINEAPYPGRIRFNSLCEYYLKADFGGDAVRPKSDHSAPGCNLENLSREKSPSRKEAGSRPYIDMGKAEDTGEEPGICTQWDRRGRGSGN